MSYIIQLVNILFNLFLQNLFYSPHMPTTLLHLYHYQFILDENQTQINALTGFICIWVCCKVVQLFLDNPKKAKEQ